MKHKRELIIIIVLALILGTTIMVTLFSQQGNKCNSNQSQPEFIVSVFPPSDFQLSLDSYKVNIEHLLEPEKGVVPIEGPYGIIVRIDMEIIDGTIYSGKYPTRIFDRVSLFIDGNLVDDAYKNGTEDYIEGVYFDENGKISEYRRYGTQGIGWALIPNLGVHEAKFTVIDSKGTPFEYVWCFEVVP